MSVSEIFMLTFENGEKMMFEEANTKEKKSDSNVAMLLGGTSVPLRMNETISSEKKEAERLVLGKS